MLYGLCCAKSVLTVTLDFATCDLEEGNAKVGFQVLEGEMESNLS